MSERASIILCPGLFGRDALHTPFVTIEYFRGVAAALAEDGHKVDVHRPLPTGTVMQRAEHLSRSVARASGKIILIGHSMGGLDARVFAAHFDDERRIKAVVTIASPHRGSPLADWIMDGRGIQPWLARRWFSRAIGDLTHAACARRNRDLRDRDDVQYLSITGTRPVAELPFWSRPYGRRIERAEGANDCMVSERSAKWGEFLGTVRADHYELMGWNLGLKRKAIDRPFDHLAMYRDLAARARAALDA